MISETGPEAAARLAVIHADSFARPWSEADMREALQTSGRLALGWHAPDGDLKGFILIQLAGDISEILTLAVHRSARRCGVAVALVEAAMTRAREAGADRMLLDVAKDNAAALALYKRAGFSEDGRRKRYYGEVDAVLMSRKLE
jgi:[ribosomal protein S18]-alanine N-acetyltransferase